VARKAKARKCSAEVAGNVQAKVERQHRLLVSSTVKLLHHKKERKKQWGSKGLQAWPETGS
jgi:hypothetical protein